MKVEELDNIPDDKHTKNKTRTNSNIFLWL